ncbi:hypothetical protein TWF225_004676 [Orbilia oligospora]|uniref:Uncharacterized protein n=1 Tax=Orbilia oligospora TaxID=2813651 RepID=A0A7C8PQ73_ORBOL|nr:hypothetical protein TWF751_007000 [Orbilia oligospora]KAF3186629.1 hypothetical protein TWF225_004676 [Orbilia oligospora]KAF3246308.1 hypothetical protein TWF217_009979 [Orbilia oligospora]KAF3266113.1 hypothetical protein TWF128_011647 [Orbilia oligospora]KAF3296783.1 hypothetical protein TWF132_009294 [Orbilia oligospora]
MTSLSNLIPELLDSILFYLRKRDILSLLRTCKYLHSVCLPYRWSRLTLYDTTTPNYDDFSIYNEPSKRRVWRLADTTDEFGVDALGYKYIKKIKILAPQTTFSIESRTVKNGFQRLLGDLIESGKINLREVALRDDNRHPIPPDVDFSLLHRIKKYSESKSPGEFSMALQTETLPPLLRTGALSLTVLTKLRVIQHLQGGTFSEEWGEFHESLSIHIEDNIIDEIEALTQLLSGAVNLRELCIQPESLRYEPGSIHSLAEPLKNLQTAFDGLKRLQKLVIGSVTYSSDSAVFFHPSFFIAPPENCKTLQYGCTASIAWWRKFAAHPLPGVENLRLSLSQMTLISSQWIDDREDEEALQQIIPGGPINTQCRTKFHIGDVAVRGLKKFTFDPEYYLDQATDPIDLEACIYRRNKGLNEAHKKKIKEEVISGFHRQILDGFSVGMARCARRIATRHFEDWMGRNANEEASAERCFEELNLEKEKHVVEFTKLLSSWAERNIDKFHFYSNKNQDEFKLLEGFIEDDV